MPENPLSLQLYTLRNETENDLPGTLKRVSEIGYRSVELAGMYGLSATELKQMLSDNGLQAPSAHVGLDALQSDGVAKVLDDYREIGSSMLVVPWVDEPWRSGEQGYAHLAEVMNEIGSRLHSQGFQLGYHNHDVEFANILEDKTGFDLLIAGTDPELVSMELDTYWALFAGHDPVEVINNNPGRILLLHIKDMDPADRSFAPVGKGSLPLDAILEAAKTTGVKNLVIEQDSCKQPPLEAIEISYNTMKQKGYS